MGTALRRTRSRGRSSCGRRAGWSRGLVAAAAVVGALALGAAPVSALPAEGGSAQGGGRPPQEDPEGNPAPGKDPCTAPGTVSQDMRWSDVKELVAGHESRNGLLGDRAKYIDSRGNPTVGVGFNLNRPDAREKLTGVGADYDEVLAGRQLLNDDQIRVLYTATLLEAAYAVERLVPNLDKLNVTRRAVLTDMVFNMGAAKLSEFTRFLAAVNAGNWDAAGAEMQKSAWYTQVGHRAVQDRYLMVNGYICASPRAPDPVSEDIPGMPSPTHGPGSSSGGGTGGGTGSGGGGGGGGTSGGGWGVAIGSGGGGSGGSAGGRCTQLNYSPSTGFWTLYCGTLVISNF